MPGCCVPNCFNSTEKGFSMRSFPSNVERRAIWMENINIHSGHQSRKWGAIKNLFVCEAHFSAEMWENVRVDGKKKLKANAIPTVFYPPKNKDIPAVEKNVDIRDDVLVEVEIASTSSKRLLTDIDTLNDVKRFRKDITDEMDIPTSDSMTSASGIDTMKELDEANKKLERANTIIRKIDKTNRNLRQRVRQLRNYIKLYKEQRFPVAQDLLQQVFYKDQIEYLTAKYKGRSVRSKRAWTNETIKKALRLKHTCGDNGYRELLRQDIPLPSTRTLRRRLECITFKDGICDEVFDLLGEKVSNFPDERYKDACICLDEMSLTPGRQIDPCTNQSIGYATIPDKYGTMPFATHGLVFMICGIFIRWKQIVAYYYTPEGFNGAILKEIILKIIEKAELVGLKVHSITSDMGAVNQSMWRAFENISATKYSKIKNSVPHPLDNSRKLFFFADAPHLLKNLRSALVNNKTIILPQNFAELYELSSCIVKCAHVEDLVAEQENVVFKLAPKLDKETIPANTDI